MHPQYLGEEGCPQADRPSREKPLLLTMKIVYHIIAGFASPISAQVRGRLSKIGKQIDLQMWLIYNKDSSEKERRHE